jgi:hypothetical protein
MNAPFRPQQIRLDPIAVFEIRAWARAVLWQSGEYETLQETVDPRWASAVVSGLTNKIGVDEVQRLMAHAFHRVRP